MNALGYTLAEHNRDLREAQTLVRKALEMTPDSAAVQDSMGWTLHRLGQQREALEWLTKAYAAEKDAEIAAHLGETLWALGQHYAGARHLGRGARERSGSSLPAEYAAALSRLIARALMGQPASRNFHRARARARGARDRGLRHDTVAAARRTGIAPRPSASNSSAGR